jgi:AcrR family transcriptional regulator
MASRKRPYRLGKRQASVDDTKRRIVAAAAEEYQINGIEDTSMQAVARRADVAPGTVLYHYPTPDDLAEAVVDSWIADMRMPTPEAIDPDAPLERRIHALVEELFGLYERSEEAYRVYMKSGSHPVLARAEAMWEKNVGEMMMRALGDRAGDIKTMQVVGALVAPGFRGNLVSVGMSSDEVVQAAADLVIGWLSRP